MAQQVKTYENAPTILPAREEERNWSFGHYFSLWMGSVHNVPSYVTIGGFFALGLSIPQVFSIIMISSLLLGAFLILNGYAGSKYGIPFSVLLWSSYGKKGAALPGILRGVITAVMWFGLQTYAGGLAVSILISKIWPAYISLGGNWSFFGINAPQLISFLLFWTLNVLLIFAGMSVLGKLTKTLTFLIFLVFGGMAVWAVSLVGGLSPYFAYTAKGVEGNTALLMLGCVSALMATWVAQMVSVSDLTRFAKSTKSQALGQLAGLFTAHLLFAAASIAIIIGSEISFGVPIWNILDVIDRFDSLFAVALSLLTICLSTLSVNLVGNLIPAGFQLAALFPGKIPFKLGALLAAIAGLLIMPWKLMENAASVLAFLNLAGGLLSPVVGVMLVDFFVIRRRKIDVHELYSGSQRDMNAAALIVTLLAGILSLSGKIIPSLQPLTEISWFIGVSSSALFYGGWHYMKLDRKNHMEIPHSS
ncbi:cytosine permease [Bacillus sp. B-jedd]|uniref:cytosine permease n=1 Tax=Bacillus sp. B-jedd TaxID=1476857 RepID=UPI0005155F5A|nr:cytosine permease [Bacillus sp. B-jedd]CEG25775.1 allantoin permease [Bacillus sp. B-jedd]